MFLFGAFSADSKKKSEETVENIFSALPHAITRFSLCRDRFGQIFSRAVDEKRNIF
jgi:hypothetical protein